MNGGGEDVSFTVYSNPDRNGIYAAYSGWSSEQNSGFNGYLAGEKIYKTDGVNFPSSKYFDIYTTIKLNDPSYYQSWALGETSGWYSDYSSVDYWTEYPVEEPEVFSPFQHRGGNYNNKYDGHSGIFYSHPHNGHAHPIASTRIVISSK